MNFSSTLGILRIVALLEGISFLSFMITMPLKRIYAIPEPNFIVGIAHGILFMLYVALVFWVNSDVKWNFKQQAGAYIASLLPFGTFIADAKLFKPTQNKAI